MNFEKEHGFMVHCPELLLSLLFGIFIF